MHRVQNIVLDSVNLEILTRVKDTVAIATSEAVKWELIALSMRGAEPELFKLPFTLLYTGSCYTSKNYAIYENTFLQNISKK